MTSTALDGASKYLNNLLLARGFLQGGNSIDFVQLARCTDTETGRFDTNSTTATIINLIHDLILRRDRDAEQREALGSTIRALRSDESQRLLDLQRLQDKNIQLKSEASTLEAEKRNLLLSAKRSQSEIKELKEQVLKVKSNLDQVRAKSISDIRKRDVELDKLKNHLSGLNRGKKESGTSKNNATSNAKSVNKDGHARQEGSTSEWSLGNENTDFLTAVLNETSAENVALRKIVGDSLQYLRTLTGLEEKPQQENVSDLADINKAIGIPGQYRDRELNNSTDSTQSDSLIPVQNLASSMTEVLAHCQTILRDPSFVPIEEVQIRDEEIAKLRIGWEKMADRWKEAVTMMGQWRQKVMTDDQEGSRSINDHHQYRSEIEDLPPMPVFSRSIATRPNGQPVLDPIQEEELTSILLDHHSRLANQSLVMNELEVTSMTHEETLPEPDETGTPRQAGIQIHEDEESDLDLSERQPAAITASPARRGITIQRPAIENNSTMPLSNSNANARKRKSTDPSPSPRKRRSISPIPTPQKLSAPPSLTTDSSLTTESIDPLHLETLTPDISDSEELDKDLFAVLDETARDSKSKSHRMTVAEKLAAVEAEATEATEVIRRRQATSYGPTDQRGKDRERSIRASTGSKTLNGPKRMGSIVKGANAKSTGQHASRDRTGQNKKKGDENRNIKDATKKARDRRRSTLTPAELGSLMGMGR